MKENIQKALAETRVVAIIRGFDPDVCLHLAEAYMNGGIRLVEVTFNQSSPAEWVKTVEAVKAVKSRLGDVMHVGAGTVMTEEQLSMCADAGAGFMVSPNVNCRLIRSCVRRGMVAMPGAMTPSEAVDAWDAGAQYVKVFPAGPLGVAYVKAVRAPLSHIPMLAVGGISAGNAAEFIHAGCAGVGVGGNLTNKEWIALRAWDKIEEAARQLVQSVSC